jgi:hypothetical protein
VTLTFTTPPVTGTDNINVIHLVYATGTAEVIPADNSITAPKLAIGAVTKVYNGSDIKLSSTSTGIDVTGGLTTTSNVGIGTTDVRGTLQIGSGNGAGNVPSGRELVFGANNSEIMFLSANDQTSVDGTIGSWNTVYNHANSKIEFDKNGWNTGQLKFYTNAGTGITERMRIDSSGIVTTPFQPAFRVQHNYSSHTTLAASSPNFTLDPLNTGNHFSLSTNRFTAPVTGTYYFSYEALVNANDATSYASFDILVNGSRVALQHSDSNSHGSYYPLSVSCVAHLNATDYVTIRVSTNDGGLYYNSDYNNFSGHLIG